MNHVIKVMKGFYLTGHGGFEKLKYKENIPLPILQDNEVLIKVHSAGLNNTDINTRIAWYSKNNILGNDINIGTNGITSLNTSNGSWAGQGIKFPIIQGIDACGEIVEVASNIDKKHILN